MAEIFFTTCWTLVLLAGTRTPEGRAALDTLCRRYQRAVLEYLLAKGLPRDLAVDFRQKLFIALIEGPLRDPTRFNGSFSAYLAKTMDHLLIDDHRARVAIKRGSGARHEPLDDAERIGALSSSPDPVFEDFAARESLELALEQAKKKFDARTKPERWDTALAVLAGTVDHETAALEFGIEPVSVRTVVKWLRKDIRDALGVLAADVVEASQVEAQTDRWLDLLEGG